MKANYHTHTQRCLHAQGTENDYILSAIHSGLDILGFSDHAPFPDVDFGLRMPYEELDIYLNEVDTLTEKYAADIILLKSLEIEYLPEHTAYYEELLGEKNLDYLLLGEHFYRSADNTLYNITSADSTACYIDYANAVAKAMKTGYFKIVAHPDIFMMNSHLWDKNCEIATDLIINTAITTNTLLEYNANGFRRGIKKYADEARYQYPYFRFWERAASSGVSVIIGSDCHNPSQVWDYAMDIAYSQLTLLGIRPLDSIETGK